MKASIKEIMAFFEIEKASDFMREWKELSEEDKEYFKKAVGETLSPDK
jgi:hypothetical protein